MKKTLRGGKTLKNQWKLHICGSRGSRSVFGEAHREFGGATSCLVLQKGDYALVVDCGTGLGNAEEILKNCTKIDVFLTHLHYDHVLGLLGWNVFPKEAKVRFFATFDEWFGENSFKELFKEPFWPIVPEIGERVTVPRLGKERLMEEVEICFFPACHPNAGSLLRVNLGEKSICILFDYEHNEPVPAKAVEGCQLVAFDGMYTPEEYENHRGWGHSTWLEGCRIAEQYGVDKLLITHHDPGRTDEELRVLEKEAQKVFGNLRFSRMGDIELI